jgi:hypothetical protein
MWKKEEIQNLADDMSSIAVDGHGYQWIFDSKKEEKFIKLISNYVKKASYKSERQFLYKFGRWDPEDAYLDVLSSVWVAFRKYGPRPLGNDFTYLLNLKTNNSLTNRARYLFSDKGKLNVISSSFEALQVDNEGESRALPKILDSDFVFYSKKPLNSVYNRAKENKKMHDYIPAKETTVGQVYVTRLDKLVEIVSIKNEVSLRVLATDRVTQVPLNYPLRPYVGSEEDPVEAEILEDIRKEEDATELVVEASVPEEEKNELVIAASLFLEEESTSDVVVEPAPSPVCTPEPVLETVPEIITEAVSETVREEEKIMEDGSVKEESGSNQKSVRTLVLDTLKERGEMTRKDITMVVASARGTAPEDLKRLEAHISVQLSVLKKSGILANDEKKWKLVS